MNDSTEKITSRIWRYLRNILLALTGCNPYQMELDKARNHLEKAEEMLTDMKEMCYSAMDRWSESQKQVAQLQQVVETLFGHLREKEDLMKQQERTYREYTERMTCDC